MSQSTIKHVLVPLCAAILVGLVSPCRTHAQVHKAVGETSTASASCAAGCSLSLRLKKVDTVVKDDIAPGVPWIWLDTWGTGAFTLECKCGDSGWHTIQTYNVVNFNLPIVSVIACQESPISVWLPENFPQSMPNLSVQNSLPYLQDSCTPWSWTNAALCWPKSTSATYSEADLSSDLGTRLVTVTAYLNGQKHAYGERQVTMARQVTLTGLSGSPGVWSPEGLLKPVCQKITNDDPQQFNFSTTVTTTVGETEIGPRAFSVDGEVTDILPPQISASASCGVYHVQPEQCAEFMDSLETQVGFQIEDSRTLSNQCVLAVDVPANSQLTVFVRPLGEERSGDYTYYLDASCSGAATSVEQGTYDAVKITGVCLDYTVSAQLP